MPLEWSEDLATGSADIDNQHKELFSRINSLIGVVEKGGSWTDEVSKTVQYLNDYVSFHFGTEEKYMARYAYSNTSAHKAQHELFVKTFERLKERLASEGITSSLTLELKNLCIDWLINHIKYSDRALGMYLKIKM